MKKIRTHFYEEIGTSFLLGIEAGARGKKRKLCPRTGLQSDFHHQEGFWMNGRELPEMALILSCQGNRLCQRISSTILTFLQLTKFSV